MMAENSKRDPAYEAGLFLGILSLAMVVFVLIAPGWLRAEDNCTATLKQALEFEAKKYGGLIFTEWRDRLVLAFVEKGTDEPEYSILVRSVDRKGNLSSKSIIKTAPSIEPLAFYETATGHLLLFWTEYGGKEKPQVTGGYCGEIGDELTLKWSKKFLDNFYIADMDVVRDSAGKGHIVVRYWEFVSEDYRVGITKRAHYLYYEMSEDRLGEPVSLKVEHKKEWLVMSPSIAADDKGLPHIVCPTYIYEFHIKGYDKRWKYEGTDYASTQTLSFVQYLYKDGQRWVGPETMMRLPEMGSQIGAQLCSSNDGNLHLIFSKYEGVWNSWADNYIPEESEQPIFYAFKPRGGQWTQPVAIVAKHRAGIRHTLTADAEGNLYIVYESEKKIFLKVRHKGKWTNPSVLIDNCDRCRPRVWSFRNGEVWVLWKRPGPLDLLYPIVSLGRDLYLNRYKVDCN